MGKSDYGIGKDGEGGFAWPRLHTCRSCPHRGLHFNYSPVICYLFGSFIWGLGAEGAQAHQPVFFLAFHFWIVKLFF